MLKMAIWTTIIKINIKKINKYYENYIGRLRKTN